RVKAMALSFNRVVGFKARLQWLVQSNINRACAAICELNHVPKRARARSRAFAASTSRSRAGALVCSDASRRRALSETSDTARLKASALACDGELNPDSLRTNCSAEAWISACVAGGSKLNNVLMLRHIVPPLR